MGMQVLQQRSKVNGPHRAAPLSEKSELFHHDNSDGRKAGVCIGKPFCILVECARLNLLK